MSRWLSYGINAVRSLATPRHFAGCGLSTCARYFRLPGRPDKWQAPYGEKAKGRARISGYSLRTGITMAAMESEADPSLSSDKGRLWS